MGARAPTRALEDRMSRDWLAERRNWLRVAAAGGLAAMLLAGSVADASAQYRYYGRGGYWGGGGAVAAGVIGGLAVGALAAGAARPYAYPYAYGPAPVYAPAPVYGPPACWYEREDVWNGYMYVPRRVRVCQ